MNPPALEDLFERYESQYVRDLEGRLIRIEAATLGDLRKLLTVAVDGQRVTGIPKAVPATDDQGNILRDEKGNVKPRLTTVYDAATWRYCQPTDPRKSAAMIQEGVIESTAQNPIPILCHQHHQRPIGVCRVCSVLTTRNGQAGGRLVPACQHPLVDGMEVHTTMSMESVQIPGRKERVIASEYVYNAVRVLLQLLAANHLHHDQAPDQRRYDNELLKLAMRFKVVATELTPKYEQVPVSGPDGRLQLNTQFRRRPYEADAHRIDDSSRVIKVDHNNCILCDRCVRGCSEVKPFKIIGHNGFGNKARVAFDLGYPMGESGCVTCGECAVSCPTGALTFKTSMYQDRNPWEHEKQLAPQTVPCEALSKQDLFQGVPYAYLAWNEGAVGRVNMPPNTVLCQEGEYGSTAFVIEEGSLKISVRDKTTGQPREIPNVRLTPRDLIVGEMACLSHQPRTATLLAAEQGARVLVVKRNMLHMLQRNRSAREILAPIYRKRALADFLRGGQLFQGLRDEQHQACLKFLSNNDDVEFVQVDPGQAVFLEGSQADRFFIIYRGYIAVSETVGAGRSLVKDYMAPGRQFGEIGLLTDPKVSKKVAEKVPVGMRGKRTASCSALDHVELITIRRDTFIDLMDAVAGLRDHLESTAIAILGRSAQRRDVVSPLMNQFATTGLYEGQNLLVLDLNRCTRCQECVKGCADSHDGVTRLVLEGNRFGEFLVPSACRSCHDPMCLIGCPVDAIHRRPPDARNRSAKSLAIVIEDHCIGCGLCAHNCPYGSIHMFDLPTHLRQTGTRKRIATNCDLCETHNNGVPQCVYRCPHDAAVRMTGQQLAEKIGLKAPAAPKDGKDK
jgi:Fe-S-cluster-containing hydrogenase component 2/CRP-like cAMP-binding protein